MFGCRYLYAFMHATFWWCMCCIPWPRVLAMIRVIERLLLFVVFVFFLLCGLRTFYCLWLARVSLSITYTCVCVCVAIWFWHHWSCDFGILVQLTLAIPLTLWLWQHLDHSTLTTSYHVWLGQHPLKQDWGCIPQHHPALTLVTTLTVWFGQRSSSFDFGRAVGYLAPRHCKSAYVVINKRLPSAISLSSRLWLPNRTLGFGNIFE